MVLENNNGSVMSICPDGVTESQLHVSPL